MIPGREPRRAAASRGGRCALGQLTAAVRHVVPQTSKQRERKRRDAFSYAVWSPCGNSGQAHCACRRRHKKPSPSRPPQKSRQQTLSLANKRRQADRPKRGGWKEREQRPKTDSRNHAEKPAASLPRLVGTDRVSGWFPQGKPAAAGKPPRQYRSRCSLVTSLSRSAANDCPWNFSRAYRPPRLAAGRRPCRPG